MQDPPLHAHEIDHRDRHADHHHHAAQRLRVDTSGQQAAEDAAGQCAHGHDQRRRPNHPSGEEKKGGRGDVDAEGDGLFERAEPREGIVDDQCQHGQNDDTQPGAEIAAVHRCGEHGQDYPGLVTARESAPPLRLSTQRRSRSWNASRPEAKRIIYGTRVRNSRSSV